MSPNTHALVVAGVSAEELAQIRVFLSSVQANAVEHTERLSHLLGMERNTEVGNVSLALAGAFAGLPAQPPSGPNVGGAMRSPIAQVGSREAELAAALGGLMLAGTSSGAGGVHLVTLKAKGPPGESMWDVSWCSLFVLFFMLFMVYSSQQVATTRTAPTTGYPSPLTTIYLDF